MHHGVAGLDHCLSRADRRRAMSCTSMDWSSLPADLLLAVFVRLPRDGDRVRFGAVCAGWGAAAASWLPRPWLVGSRTDRFGRDAAMPSFWLSPGGGGLVPFAAAVPDGFEYLSSSHGYLALSDPTTTPKAIALVNPVTGRRIRLPPIGFFKRWHDVATVVLSADPDTADEWTAVAVGFPTNCLAYYSSTTGAWTPAPELDMSPDREWEPEEEEATCTDDGGELDIETISNKWARRDETIYPDDGRRGGPSAGWARRGWF